MKDITYCGQVVGTAKTEIMGLYLQINCICNIPDAGFFGISLMQSGERRFLGTCIPVSGHLELRTRIPKKYYREEQAVFVAHPKNKNPKYVSLVGGQPIDQLADLDHGRLIFVDQVPFLQLG